MTTIAYARGMMAADSTAAAKDVHMARVRKLWRVGGGLVGMAGSIVAMPAFVRWIAEGAHEEDYPLRGMGEFDALVVDPSGRITMYESSSAEPIRNEWKYAAIGSGATVALGALAAGADARTAVRAAIKHTDGSKPPVRVLRLGGTNG